MSEKPKSLIPPSLGNAKRTMEALKETLTQKEREDLEAALRYAKEGIVHESEEELDWPDKIGWSDWPEW